MSGVLVQPTLEDQMAKHSHPHIHGSTLGESIEKGRVEREAAGAALAQSVADQNPTPANQPSGAATYVLYTYQTVDGALSCHVYGPPTTNQIGLHNIGEQLSAETNGALAYMVLPLEQAPAEEPALSTRGARAKLWNEVAK